MPPQNFKLPLLGLVVIALIAGLAIWYQKQQSEPTKEVHVHSDILVYIGDERVRFTDPKYQSRTDHILHPDFHFHDGNDDVVHRHADGITLVEFFASLGFTLTKDCLTMDTGVQHCFNENDRLMLFVNGIEEKDIANYIPEDEDRILLYFGSPTNPKLAEYKDGISDRACIYSGNCPERGTPPTEECGLTCEL